MALKWTARRLSILIDCLDNKTVVGMIKFSFAVWAGLTLMLEVETYLIQNGGGMA